MRTLVLFTAASILTTLTATAQTAAPQRGPDSTTHNFVPGIDILPYPNLPFTGYDRIEWQRVTPGGAAVTVYVDAKSARDSQGRLYRERHHFAPQGTDPQKSLYEFYIEDPLAHTRTTCESLLHLCHVSAYFPRFSTAVQPAGPFDQGRRYLVRDGLGNDMINGMAATGTRETVTIAAGTVGNQETMTTTRDFWYSSDLKLNLKVVRKSPLEGTQTILLDVQSRSEPDPSTFSIPAGYRSIDDRHPLAPPSTEGTN